MWKLIEAIDWVNLSKEPRGYNKGQVFVRGYFTPAARLEMIDFVDARVVELTYAIHQYEAVNGVHCGDYTGDDSFSDMVYHVVGLGEKTFNAVMQNPATLNVIGSVESFAYVLH